MRGTVALVRVLMGAAVVASWPVALSAQPTATRPDPDAPPALRQADDPHRHDQATPQTPTAPPAQPSDEHAGHLAIQPLTPIPQITDADRAAAFPDVAADAAHRGIHSLVLFDQLEWQTAESTDGLNWDGKGWIGGDRNRLWFRTEGGTEDWRLGDAEAHLFYGRAFARWWDLVVGVRQDIRPGPARTWAAVGVQGLAPYWLQVEATGYVSQDGQAALRLKAEYELLLTSRLVLQPLVEVNLYGKANGAHGTGTGLGTTDIGLRLRYELRRELAPYIGLTWVNDFGDADDRAEAARDNPARRRFVAGIRLWH